MVASLSHMHGARRREKSKKMPLNLRVTRVEAPTHSIIGLYRQASVSHRLAVNQSILRFQLNSPLVGVMVHGVAKEATRHVAHGHVRRDRAHGQGVAKLATAYVGAHRTLGDLRGRHGHGPAQHLLEVLVRGPLAGQRLLVAQQVPDLCPGEVCQFRDRLENERKVG